MLRAHLQTQLRHQPFPSRGPRGKLLLGLGFALGLESQSCHSSAAPRQLSRARLCSAGVQGGAVPFRPQPPAKTGSVLGSISFLNLSLETSS